MHLGYISSKAGILKIISVAIGLIVAVWMFVIVTNTEYLKDEKMDDVCAKTLEKVSDKTCPKRIFVLIAFIIVAGSFVGSAILLLVLLCVELNKNGLFKMLDYIGHFVAGLLLIVGAILMITYVALVFDTYECSDTLGDKMKKECEENREKNYGVIQLIICGIISFINGAVYILLGGVIQKS